MLGSFVKFIGWTVFSVSYIVIVLAALTVVCPQCKLWVQGCACGCTHCGHFCNCAVTGNCGDPNCSCGQQNAVPKAGHFKADKKVGCNCGEESK